MRTHILHREIQDGIIEAGAGMSPRCIAMTASTRTKRSWRAVIEPGRLLPSRTTAAETIVPLASPSPLSLKAGRRRPCGDVPH